MSRLQPFSEDIFDLLLYGNGALVKDPIDEEIDTLRLAVQGHAAYGERLGATTGGITPSSDLETTDLGEDVDGLTTALRGAMQLDNEAVTIETSVIELAPGRIKTLQPRLDGTPLMGGAARASVTIGSGESAIEAVARDVGTGGDSISVTLTDPGVADTALSVSVTGQAIDVTLATDAGSVITSTAREVASAINSDSDASALVIASFPPNQNGTGIMSAAAPTSLAGGADAGTEQTGTVYDPRPFFKDEDYIDRLALLLQSRNKQVRMAIIFYNCLVTSGLSMEAPGDMTSYGVPVTWTAMSDGSRRDPETGSYAAPYRVIDNIPPF